MLLQACGNTDSDTDKTLGGKKNKLNRLLKQQEKLNSEIAVLEEEIAKLDTTTKHEATKLVAVRTLEAAPFSSEVEVMGKIDVESNANISASMPGTITKIYVKEGSYVKTGQTLALIDNDVIRQNIALIRQQLSFATELYNKQKNLWEQKIGSEVQYLTAKNNKETLEANLAVLNQQNDLYRIKALFPGIVDKIDAKVGQTASPGMPAFRIVGTQGMKFNAEIPESYASKIANGSNVVIFLPDLGKEITGKVNYISKVVDPLNRTFTAEILIGGNKTDIKTNMIGILRIKDYSNKNAIVVPIKTLQRNNEGYYVYVAREANGQLNAVEIPIKTGAVNNENIEVLTGLKPGDQLITTGFQSLRDGDLLKVSNN